MVPAIWSDASLQSNTPHCRRGPRKPTLCNVLEARKRRRAHNLLGDESLLGIVDYLRAGTNKLASPNHVIRRECLPS